MCKESEQEKEKQILVTQNKFSGVYSWVKNNFLFLHSAIDNYSCAFLNDDHYTALSSASPTFFYVTQTSIALSIIATINELVDRRTVVGIQTLVQIARTNKSDCDKVKIDCESIMSYIKSGKSLLRKIRTARNKLYCHFDKEVLNKQFIKEINEAINFAEIKTFLIELEYRITDLRLHYFNDGHKELLSYINSLDVDDLIDIIKQSDKMKRF